MLELKLKLFFFFFSDDISDDDIIPFHRTTGWLWAQAVDAARLGNITLKKNSPVNPQCFLKKGPDIINFALGLLLPKAAPDNITGIFRNSLPDRCGAVAMNL